MPQPLPVVIEIDDTVDVILVPSELAMRARSAAPAAEQRPVLEVIALLLARLGSETAVPAIHDWLDRDPQRLTSFPEPLRSALVSGEIG
jgi:hypothetical protein